MTKSPDQRNAATNNLYIATLVKYDYSGMSSPHSAYSPPKKVNRFIERHLGHPARLVITDKCLSEHRPQNHHKHERDLCDNDAVALLQQFVAEVAAPVDLRIGRERAG